MKISGERDGMKFDFTHDRGVIDCKVKGRGVHVDIVMKTGKFTKATWRTLLDVVYQFAAIVDGYANGRQGKARISDAEMKKRAKKSASGAR